MSDLEQVEGHVALGESHIDGQRKLIIRLEEAGIDTVDAKQLLVTFLEMQVLHVAHRDRLIKKLEAS